MKKPSKVAFLKLQNEPSERTIKDNVKKAMRLLDWQQNIKGNNLAIKPNLVSDFLLPGQNTSPWVLEAVIEEIIENTNINLTMIESETLFSNFKKTLKSWRLSNFYEKYDVPLINLSKEKMIEYELDGLKHKKIRLPQKIFEFDGFINVPVLKTHVISIFTGAMKNWWGLLCKEDRHNYHIHLQESLVDLHLQYPPQGLRPCFTIIDGIICLEGGGPKTGKPRVEGLIMASDDVVALDAMAARYIGIDPYAVGYLTMANRYDIGNIDQNDIDIIGDEFMPARVPFESAAGKSVAANYEMLLRNYLLKNDLNRIYDLIFRSKFFNLFSFFCFIFSIDIYMG